MAHLAIAHPCLGMGGSEARAVWCLQALRDAGHRVSLLTYARPASLLALNLHCGTSLRPGDLDWQQASFPVPTRALAKVKWRLFERFVARAAPRYDAIISAHNPLDIQRRCIQFVADFSWDEDVRLSLDPAASPAGLRRLLQPTYNWLTRPRRRAADWLGGHLIVANSHWTADRLKELYGLGDCPVVHPPVMSVAATDSKTNQRGVLWMGRVCPEKRLEDAVAIIARVRAAGHDVELWVGGEVESTEYARRLVQRARGAPWVRFLGQVEGVDKLQLLQRTRFGLHTRPREPFGIAVAEMMKAGCIVFAPADGGPREMLTGTPLLFQSVADAAQAILRMLDSPETWDGLSQEVAARAQSYSTASFSAAVVELVGQLMGQRVRQAI